MRTIQKFLPNPRYTEVHRIFVNAKPEQAWIAARYFDMSKVYWIKMLFDIRTFPENILGIGKIASKSKAGFENKSPINSGFKVLFENPGHVVVIGSIGQFWQSKFPPLKISSEDFKDFNLPGFGKIAWSISVEPFNGGSAITIEVRTSSTDEKSWNKLNLHNQSAGIGSNLIRLSIMAYLESELGKMELPDYENQELPGDKLILNTKNSISFQRTIEAPISIVWNYLMQLGCDRAGWFSIDFQEKQNESSSHFCLEDRKVGDRIPASLHDDKNAFKVFDLDLHRHIVLVTENNRSNSSFRMTWSFILDPIGGDATHCISRARMESFPKLSVNLQGRIANPRVHWLMSHIQLDTIKKFAERDAQARIVKNVISNLEVLR